VALARKALPPHAERALSWGVILGDALMPRRVPLIEIVALFFLAIASFSCGGSHSSTPTPPTTVAAAPNAPPPPAPPGAGPVPASCANPPVGGGTCGSRPNPILKSTLVEALDEVRAEKDIFYPDGATIRYLDRARAKLVAALDARGVCGVFDFGDGSGFEIY